MTTETVTIERYVVRKGMHLGALRRELKVDDIIEWQPETETFKLNGFRIDSNSGVEPSEAMRQLRALNTKNPDHPAIEELQMASAQVESTAALETSTLCVLPILGCLKAAEKYMEDEKSLIPELTPVTDEQREFLELFEDLMMALEGIPELKSKADDTAAVINAWFKEHGFDIELPEPDAEGFAVGSIIDVLLEWLHQGARTTITGKTGDEYVGVHVKEGVHVSHMLAVHPHPVVRIATKSGDTVMRITATSCWTRVW